MGFSCGLDFPELEAELPPVMVIVPSLVPEKRGSLFARCAPRSLVVVTTCEYVATHQVVKYGGHDKHVILSLSLSHTHTHTHTGQGPQTLIPAESAEAVLAFQLPRRVE